jgi:hypothetical protein
MTATAFMRAWIEDGSSYLLVQAWIGRIAIDAPPYYWVPCQWRRLIWMAELCALPRHRRERCSKNPS